MCDSTGSWHMQKQCFGAVLLSLGKRQARGTRGIYHLVLFLDTSSLVQFTLQLHSLLCLDVSIRAETLDACLRSYQAAVLSSLVEKQCLGALHCPCPQKVFTP